MGAGAFPQFARLSVVVVAALAATTIVLKSADGRSGAGPSKERAGVAQPKRGTFETVWAVGDGADGSSDSKAVASRIDSGNPDRFLYLGDIYDSGTAGEFNVNYAPVYDRFDEIAAPTPGNHEWGNRKRGYFPYWKDATGERMRKWYGFNIGGWQILSLNSEAGHGSRSPQLRWLRKRLHATRGKGTCRIAFWHRPRYSAGYHGDDGDLEPFWDALAGKARLVLNGHDHNMQRFSQRRGIVEFVAGSGGYSPTSLDENDPRLKFGADYTDGALRLRLEPEQASYAFINAAGSVRDSGTVQCQRGN